MNRYLQTFLRSVLILVLAIGPLRAQTEFACPMMGMVMDECCCDDHQTGQDCVSSVCEAAVDSDEGPCCERSVSIEVDEDTRQDAQIATSLEIRSDIDPPPVIASSFDVIATSQGRAVLVVFRNLPVASHSRSDTYLITQRLRI
jgi:hypothetical protein